MKKSEKGKEGDEKAWGIEKKQKIKRGKGEPAVCVHHCFVYHRCLLRHHVCTCVSPHGSHHGFYNRLCQVVSIIAFIVVSHDVSCRRLPLFVNRH